MWASMATERLQKILAHGGVASRRAAEALITAGRVRVNGNVVKELGAKADPHKDKVEIDGKRVVAESFVYLLVHKPRGVVATMNDPEGRPTVGELLKPVGARVYPIGRLDFATSGVLLCTNDGAFAEGLMHPKKAVPKTYVLKVQGEMQAKDIEKWRTGIQLEDGITLPAEAKMIRHEQGKTWLELTIREGRNQQIRRMGEAAGFMVMRLARTSFAGINSEGVRPGQCRYLTREELIALKKAYGVPTRIPAAPEEVVTTARSGRSNSAMGSVQRSGSRPAKPEARTRTTSRSNSGGRVRPRRGAEAATSRSGSGSRAGARPESNAGSNALPQPRLSGGSARGRTPERTPDEAPRAEVGGRRGRGRTTGTGGGIGAEPGNFRLERGRRGRR